MDELIAFVRACLDREEQVALAIRDDRYGDNDTDDWKHWAVEDQADHPWPYLSALGVRLAHSYADNVITPQRGAHIAMQDPAHTLARIAGDRQILAEYQTWAKGHDPDRATEFVGSSAGLAALTIVVQLMAQRYAGWDGWREEWAA